jgi:transposase
VACGDCGARVERLPWASGKERTTKSFQWFLSGWARRLSWRETAQQFGTSWDTVFRSVKMAVCWGLRHRDTEGIEAIGVDEVAYRKGHKYLTLVYQIDRGSRRLLWIGEGRTKRTLRRFFRWYGKRRTGLLKYVCSDMWSPYLSVIAKQANEALHILDRFHIVALFNKAIDKVRAEEARRLKAKGYEILKGVRWLLLKRRRNLSRKEVFRLKDLLAYNLKTVKCYLMKEDFQRIWAYKARWRIGSFFQDWLDRAKRSRIEPMKKLAGTLDRHAESIFNWFEAKGEISAGAVEGMNLKVKLTTRRSFGFRGKNTLKYALYHNLGKLPEPDIAHKFCG